MKTGGNLRANHWQAKGLQSTIPNLWLKVFNQKVSFIKIDTIHTLLFKPKIDAKLTFSYGICKFYARAYAHI